MNLRFGEIAAVITVLVMYGLIMFGAPQVEKLPPAFAFLGWIGALVVSIGVYRFLAVQLIKLAEQSLRIRKFALGRNFIEGTWVGRIVRPHMTYYTVEYFSQASGKLELTGNMYEDDGTWYADWNSFVAQVDATGEKLHYMYNCQIGSSGAGAGRHRGLGDFTLYREKTGKAPVRMEGHATDLTDVKADPNTEYKISDTHLAGSEGFSKAKAHFEAM